MSSHCDRIICEAPWRHNPIGRGQPFTATGPMADQMNRANFYVPQDRRTTRKRINRNT